MTESLRHGVSTAEMQELGHEGREGETQSVAEMQELEHEGRK